MDQKEKDVIEVVTKWTQTNENLINNINEKSGWTRNPPTELGHYWWWDEDTDHYPIMLDVCMGLHGTLFAHGDHPYSEPQDVCELDGYWKHQETPKRPYITKDLDDGIPIETLEDALSDVVSETERFMNKIIERADFNDLDVLFYLIGFCPRCKTLIEHHIDEPFATCGCGTMTETCSPLQS